MAESNKIVYDDQEDVQALKNQELRALQEQKDAVLAMHKEWTQSTKWQQLRKDKPMAAFKKAQMKWGFELRECDRLLNYILRHNIPGEEIVQWYEFKAQSIENRYAPDAEEKENTPGYVDPAREAMAKLLCLAKLERERPEVLRAETYKKPQDD
jgi:hypothetical protein